MHPDDAALTVCWESQDAWMAYGEADLYGESEPDEAGASAEETLCDCGVDDGDWVGQPAALRLHCCLFFKKRTV